MTDPKITFRAEIVGIEKTTEMDAFGHPSMRVTLLVPLRDTVPLAALLTKTVFLGEIDLSKPSPEPSPLDFRWEDNLPDPVQDLQWGDWQRTHEKSAEHTCWDTTNHWFCSVDEFDTGTWKWLAVYAQSTEDDTFPEQAIEQTGLAKSCIEAMDFARAWALAHAREPKRLLDIVNTPDL